MNYESPLYMLCTEAPKYKTYNQAYNTVAFGTTPIFDKGKVYRFRDKRAYNELVTQFNLHEYDFEISSKEEYEKSQLMEALK